MLLISFQQFFIQIGWDFLCRPVNSCMHLHVISFDIPYPATYGGVIDVYYKVRALTRIGIKVHLHCYEYGRAHSPELNRICESVYYYLRLPPLFALPLRRPYIVGSRKSQQLLDRLESMPFPILFEGLHTCFHLDESSLASRVKLVRTHNVESDYYEQLAKHEANWAKRAYFKREARLLADYEPILSHADHLLTISPKDQRYFDQKFTNARYLPAFHTHDTLSVQAGSGAYCLYHGNLRVPENHRAAVFLIREVFKNIQYPLIIAGANPRPELITLASQHEHITLRHNVGEGEMLDLMRNAHIHILPSFQDTGIKLKLLNSLFAGRFCVVHPATVLETGLESTCFVARSAADFKGIIHQLMQQAFSEREIEKRTEILLPQFSNSANAEALKALIQASADAGGRRRIEGRE